MNTYLYILLGWLAFDVVVYAYMFYDMHSEQIDIKGRFHRIAEAITEEE